VKDGVFVDMKDTNSRVGLTASVCAVILTSAAPERGLKRTLVNNGEDAETWEEFNNHTASFEEQATQMWEYCHKGTFVKFLRTFLSHCHPGLSEEELDGLSVRWGVSTWLGLCCGMVTKDFLLFSPARKWLKDGVDILDGEEGEEVKAGKLEGWINDTKKFEHSPDPRAYALTSWTREKFSPDAGTFVNQVKTRIRQVFAGRPHSQQVRFGLFVVLGR
jgi:hypothetical protein